MQEEIENRTVNLAISTTKLTARGIIRLAAKGLAYIKRKSREAALKTKKPDGRQTIQQLIGQNQGVTNIDISQTDLKGFEKYARKYGVDYAITKRQIRISAEVSGILQGARRRCHDSGIQRLLCRSSREKQAPEHAQQTPQAD